MQKINNDILDVYGAVVTSAVHKALKICAYQLETEDAIQIGWLTLFSVLKNMRAGCNNYAYASIRVYGAVIDESRKRTYKKGPVRVSCPHDSIDQMSQEGKEFLAGVSKIQYDKISLEQAINSLNNDERALIMNHYAHEKPLCELRKDFGVCASLIYKQHAKALSNLRAVLTAE